MASSQNLFLDSLMYETLSPVEWAESLVSVRFRETMAFGALNYADFFLRRFASHRTRTSWQWRNKLGGSKSIWPRSFEKCGALVKPSNLMKPTSTSNYSFLGTRPGMRLIASSNVCSFLFVSSSLASTRPSR